MTDTLEDTAHDVRRLDQALCERGLFDSRAKAREAIEAGCVLVDGRVVNKPAQRVSPSARIEATSLYPWVSRGGVKLAAALDRFGFDPRDRICLDVGASTGGFTDVLLAGGATRIHAVDVGRDQMHPRIKDDARVVDHQGTDIRTIAADLLSPPPSLVVCDVSFISLALVLPAISVLAAERADLVALIKPQFEVGKGNTQRGIVRDKAAHNRVCDAIAATVAQLGWRVVGLHPSPIAGGDGNVEFLIGASR